MPWSKPTAFRFSDIPGMDWRAEWLLGPGIAEFLPQGPDMLIPFIISLRDKGARAIINRLLDEGMGDGRTGPPFYISPFYLTGLEKTPELREEFGSEFNRHFTMWAPLAFFIDLLEGKKELYRPLRNVAKEIRLSTPIPGVAPNWKVGQRIRPLADPAVGPPEGGWPQGTVVMGVIDDGIAIAHEHFRRGNGQFGTRVECFWRQREPVSQTVDFGLEICRRDTSSGSLGIDSLLQQSLVAGGVDEDLFYRKAGVLDFTPPFHNGVAWHAAHGTHVLDIAAGADPKEEDVNNRPIVCVQLPTLTTADTSGSTDLTQNVLYGIHYIIARANAMSGNGPKLPVVINLSYGIIAGPHDGSTLLEREIDSLITLHAGRLQVVMPSGNSHLSRCHATTTFPRRNARKALKVRVQPDDRTESWVQLWMPHDDAPAATSQRLRVSIIDPMGNESPALPDIPGTGVNFTNQHGDVVGSLTYALANGGAGPGVFCLNLAPTTRLAPTQPATEADRVVQPGIWKIKLRNVGLSRDERVHLWIQRDDTAYGYPRRGRQAYFANTCYDRFNDRGFVIEDDPPGTDCEVTRSSLVNALATGDKPLVTGGFARKSRRIAPYSAGGPIIAPPGPPPGQEKRKPDACLVSDDSKVHAGLLAAGTHSGSTVPFNGTSVAAPQLARLVADRLAAGQPVDRAAIKALAQAADPGPPPPPPAHDLSPPPPERVGWGRIELPPRVRLPRYWD